MKNWQHNTLYISIWATLSVSAAFTISALFEPPASILFAVIVSIFLGELLTFKLRF